MNYYMSDMHFMNEEIFKRTWRDKIFSSMEEMGKVIIQNINDVVKEDDTLYILGDLSSHYYDPTKELKAMKCKKVLIAGNHDARWLKHKHFVKQFEAIYDIKAVHDADTRIVLCHYPLAEWDGFWKGHWHFYGHVHNSREGAGKLMKGIEHARNVGVDKNDFKPMTAKQLMGLEYNDCERN